MPPGEIHRKKIENLFKYNTQGERIVFQYLQCSKSAAHTERLKMFSVTWINGDELCSVATPNGRTAELLCDSLNGTMQGQRARLWFTAKGGKLELVK